VRDGHRFDLGPTLFLMPEVFAETYAALGARMDEQLDLRRIDPTYRVRFDDGLTLSLTSDLHSLHSQLEAIEPGAFGGLLRYLDEGRLNYHTSLQRFVGRNFYHLAQYFSRPTCRCCSSSKRWSSTITTSASTSTIRISRRPSLFKICIWDSARMMRRRRTPCCNTRSWPAACGSRWAAFIVSSRTCFDCDLARRAF
jgi:phytoene dehydrogenase-like protein